ncbi:MAG: C4-dicarboxylic acid transporter DauA [Planctomycetes bacterium]|nr:C4-dicarboxylic acid transporter DauA [Planctomycetota bacterium]
MSPRPTDVKSLFPQLAFRPFAALRETFAAGYGKGDLRADLLAGAVVGVVALPLSMALAIASGVPPQHGLYTAIVAGGLIALLGGSRVQVSGPTAAFVVILSPIAAEFGIGGLLIATLMAGVMLVIMGITRFGRLIQFIPYPVTIGFTAGIGVVIATLQLKDLLGLTIPAMPDHYVERVATIATALPTVHFADFGVGLVTFAILLFWSRVDKRVPAPLVALTVAGVGCALLERFVPGFEVATIRERFSYTVENATHPGIPQLPPLFVLPWTLPDGTGQAVGFDWHVISTLLPKAFAIAMLGAIESLLSAVVADGMTGAQHDPDAELIAQGAGNIAAPFFGGIAATGAIARTATNVRAGARSPISAVVHALVVLAAVLVLAPWLGYLPMAALAALLMLVAWNMSEVKHVVHSIRVSPKSDVLVLIACFALTVLFDMVIAVSWGVALASLLFMRRMIEITEVKLVSDVHPSLREKLPPKVAYYEIAGPLFFGAAHKAMSALHTVHDQATVVLLDMRAVPGMDATGKVNLKSAISRLHKDGLRVVLAGVRPQPAQFMHTAGWVDDRDRLSICTVLEDGVQRARDLAERPPPTAHATHP